MSIVVVALAVVAGILVIASGFPNAPGWLVPCALFLLSLGLALVGLGKTG